MRAVCFTSLCIKENDSALRDNDIFRICRSWDIVEVSGYPFVTGHGSYHFLLQT